MNFKIAHNYENSQLRYETGNKDTEFSEVKIVKHYLYSNLVRIMISVGVAVERLQYSQTGYCGDTE